jgi:hypothetical protein
VPAWLDYLRNVGSLAAIRQVSPPRRLLLGLPTTDLAAAAVAVGAVAGAAYVRVRRPLDIPGSGDVGARVSAFVDAAYRDMKLVAADGSGVKVGWTHFSEYADSVRVLPDGFDERSDRKLKQNHPVRTAWTAMDLNGTNAMRVHARCSAHPVIVVGQRSALAADLADLDAVWPFANAFVDVGFGLDGWFRHPVLVCDDTCEPTDWLCGCQPALVVCDGAAAWRSQLRRALPDVAHILVADRRSRAAVQLVEEIQAGNPTTEPAVPAPPVGIEAWRIGEGALSTLAAYDEGDLF